MKQPKTKLIAWSYYKYLKGAKAVTASGIKVIELNISERSNYLFEGRIASDPKLKLYWDSNGKAHGNNPEHDLRLEVKLTFWERLWKEIRDFKKPKNKLIAFSFVKWSNEDCKVVTASGIEVTELRYYFSINANRDLVGRIASDPKLKLYWDIEGKFDGNNRDYDLRIEREVPQSIWEL